MFSHGRILIAGLCLAAAPASASLIFTTNFAPSVVADFGSSNAALLETAFTYAEAQFSSDFTNNIHVNITVDGSPGTSILGESSTAILTTSYLALQAALLANQSTADNATAVGPGGSIPSTDPVSGTHTWWVTSAQAKALGLTSDSLSNDGTITFGAGFSYTFDPANRAVSGDFDFVGVAEHEISEVMGRIGLCGATQSGDPNSYTLLDAFSFTGAGARGLGNGGGNSFSINDGSTLLMGFNNQASNGGDCRDWASGSNDSFNAFSSSGVENNVSAVDLRELNAIGYSEASPTPEPSTGVLVISGMLIGFLIRRRAVSRA